MTAAWAAGALLLLVLAVAAESALLGVLFVVAVAVVVVRQNLDRHVTETATRHSAARRAQVESLAVVDVTGGCGWCGARGAHRDSVGRLVEPREWHGAEIEEWIALRPIS